MYKSKSIYKLIFIMLLVWTFLISAYAQDLEPPTFVEVTGDTTGTTGDLVTLKAVVQDNVGVTEVSFHIGETLQAASLVEDEQPGVLQAQSTYKTTFRIPAGSVDAILYYVEASDEAGNTARSPETGTYTISVTDNDAPTDVAVISPNGGEEAGIGLKYDIKWTAKDNIGVTATDLFYSPDNGATWQTIATGEANDGLYTWTVPNDPTTEALVKVVASDAASNTAEDVSNATFTIKFIISIPPVLDDFESGLWRWETTGSWGVTDESAHSGTRALTDSPKTLYGNSTDTYAKIKLDLSGTKRPILTFWERHLIASGDYAYVELSTDNSNWTRLYYRVGTNIDWTQRRIDLGTYALKPQVWVRFRLTSDGSSQNDGWYIDDVSITDNDVATVSLPFFDDVETTASESTWITSGWRRTTTSGHSGIASWRIDTSGTSPEVSDVWLVLSAPLDLSATPNPQLVFWHRYQLNYWGDYARVYVSADGGRNFSEIYNYSNSTQSSFTRFQLSLTSYAGNTQVVIAFMFDWDRKNSNDFWEIDDIAVDDAASAVLLQTPINPTQRSLDISWAQSNAANFAYYALERRTNPSSSWQTVKTITDIATTQFTDTNLELLRTYSYRLFVVKTGDVYGVSSNEVFGVTQGVAFPFNDDFESGLSNWDVQSPWGITTEAAHGGANSLTDSPSIPNGPPIFYGNNINLSAATGLDLSSAWRPILTFWERHLLASGDYGYVEVSTDNEANWARLYYQMGTSIDWQQRRVDLGPYTGKSAVRIRFRLTSDGSANQDGWYIDDVSITDNAAAAVSLPFFDDVETTASESTWIASGWRRTTTSGHSGIASWRIDTSGTSPDYSDVWLVLSAPLDLSATPNPQLVFWHRYQISSSIYNYGRVYVSADGGKNFSQLAYYNGRIQSNFTHVQLSLAGYAGNAQVVIAFLFDWDRGNSGDFWEIDDIAVDDAASAVLLQTPINPTQRSLDISWAQSNAANFAYYALERRTNPSGSWQTVKTFNDIATTQFTDTNLELRRTYYYRLFVVKTGDVYSVSSNEVFGVTQGVAFPFMDDFESGLSNWDVQSPWGITTEDAHSGANSLTDSPFILYDNNIDRSIVTGLDLSSARRPILTFWERHVIASGDYGYVEVSNDNEANWARLYYQIGASTAGWQLRRIDLGPYAGKSTVRIRFRFTSDSSGNQEGWYIDDMSITDNDVATVSLPFFDDVETTASESTWIASGWRRTTTSGHSGIASWRIDTSGTSPDYSDVWLVLSAPLDLSATPNPQLVFWHRYQLYGGTYNCGRVYVSADGGKNFSQLTYYYGTQGNFTRVQLSLAGYTGNAQVVIAFVFDWNRYQTSDFWEIDDISVYDESPAVDFAKLDSPASIALTVGETTPNIYGLVYEPSVTDAEGQGAGITAQLGYGPDGTQPGDTWTWVDATYDSDVTVDTMTCDKYTATLTVGVVGTYDYAYRFKLTGGAGWIYADLDGNDFGVHGTNGYSIDKAGHLQVKEIVPSPPGDVNADGLVNIFDLTKLERVLVELDPLPIGANPDANQDGDTNILDLTAIERIIVGLPVGGPASPISDSEIVKLHLGSVINTSDSFTITLKADNVHSLDTAFFRLNYDPAEVELVEIKSGKLLLETEPLVNLNAGNGEVMVVFNLPGLEGRSGDGVLVSLSFRLLDREKEPASVIQLSNLQLGSTEAYPIVKGRDMVVPVPYIPRRTELLSNYPNPFNPETWIPFKLAEASEVTIHIYDVAGRLVRTLPLGYRNIGVYTSRSTAAHWDGANEYGEKVSSGVYFYSLRTSNFFAVKKLVLMK